MAFTVYINSNEIFPVIYLKNDAENTIAEIYTFGALLNSFSVNAVNLIDGFISPENAKENITIEFRSAKLSPFVCRMANSKYIFSNHEYIINKFHVDNEAIHGLLYDVIFSVIDSHANDDTAFVKLKYDYAQKNEGFPFIYSCIVTYMLTCNNSLSIETTIKNNSDTAMPVCDGWHPYFTLDCKIDELSFEVNADKITTFNSRLIPTGNIIEYKQFQQPEIIGNIILDNCFLLNKNNKAACKLYNSKSGLTLTIKPDNSYPYLQVYTPGNRKSIAIENLSAIPDAFNNKKGLKILKVGESAVFKTSFIASVEL